MPGEMIPVIAMLVVFSVPIIAILTAHQRKMAELMRSQPQHDLRRNSRST